MRETLKRLLFVGLVVVAACGGGDDDGNPVGPGGNNNAAGKGTLTALIDGVSYAGTINAASLTNGVLNIASNTTDLTRAIAFAARINAPGSVTVASSDLSMTVQTTNGTAVTGVWTAAGTLGSGAVTVTSISAAGASGTFSFNAPAFGQGATGTKVVTNGVFTATF